MIVADVADRLELLLEFLGIERNVDLEGDFERIDHLDQIERIAEVLEPRVGGDFAERTLHLLGDDFLNLCQGIH